jgi:hypothetical protein
MSLWIQALASRPLGILEDAPRDPSSTRTGRPLKIITLLHLWNLDWGAAFSPDPQAVPKGGDRGLALMDCVPYFPYFPRFSQMEGSGTEKRRRRLIIGKMTYNRCGQTQRASALCRCLEMAKPDFEA